MEGMIGGPVNLHLVISVDWIQLYVSSDMGLAVMIQTLITPGFQQCHCFPSMLI